MRLLLERRWRKPTYTIGVLSVDGARFCETVEDRDRGLKQSDALAWIQAKKVYGETAIPTGTYRVRMDITSPKYAGVKWYKDFCGGKMPRLADVPGFDGILLHPGNSALDSWGCICPGRNTKVGQVTSSRDTWKALYKKLRDAYRSGEEITITIV